MFGVSVYSRSEQGGQRREFLTAGLHVSNLNIKEGKVKERLSW